ncbi:hypothetical protein DFJ73DRAFT_943182 [Zopfochytrium polystomum]|nr:hypothetical protein DFJ73DRAFT_943182 [Zopfochytrium polystomum]
MCVQGGTFRKESYRPGEDINRRPNTSTHRICCTFKITATKISHYALGIILQQLNLATQAGPNSLSETRERFTLKTCALTGGSPALQLNRFTTPPYRRWMYNLLLLWRQQSTYLFRKSNGPLEQSQEIAIGRVKQTIVEPETVAVRGRPKTWKPRQFPETSTARIPTHFELVEGTVRQRKCGLCHMVGHYRHTSRWFNSQCSGGGGVYE